MLRKATTLTALSIAMAFMSISAKSESLDTSLSNDSVRLQYATPLSNNDLNVGADFLHHENDGSLGGLSLYVSGKSLSSSNQQKNGIGTKFIYFNADGSDADGSALALGGFFRHTLSSANLVSIRADIFYAPSVVAFGDSDRYFEASLRAEYKLMERADIFAGVRKVEIGLQNFQDADIDKGAFAGLIIHF